MAAQLDGAGLESAVLSGVRAVVWRRAATLDGLRQAVAAVSEGLGSLPPDLTGMLMRRLRDTRPREGRALLDERERDVLRLVADGCDTLEIARRLAYSERTIKAILHDVTTRLHLRSRAHAVAFLIRHGAL